MLFWPKAGFLLAKSPLFWPYSGQKVLNQVVLDSPLILIAGSGDGGAGSGGVDGSVSSVDGSVLSYS